MEPQSNIGKSFGYTTQIKDLTVISKPSFFYLTSAIYPLEFIDSVISKSEEITGRSNTSDDLGVYRFNQDNVKTNITQISGTLKVALKVYSYYKGEQDIDKVLSNVTDVTGILREVLLRYNINFENIKTSIANVSAVLRSALILYAFYKEEKIFSAVTGAEMFSDALPLTYTSFIEGSNGSGVQPMFAMSLFNYAETNYTSTYTSSGFSSNIVNLNFKEELTELDSHNLVLTFGKKTSSSGTKPPEVEVNEYTTVALDFENDLIDKIPTTIWQTQGTATVEEDNIILGKKSLETKALGDSLYTNSNVITGGSTPYTIDFYFIYKDKLVPSGYGPALLSQSQVGGGGEQEIMVDEVARTLKYFRNTGFGSNVLNSGHIISNKYGINEITKCTITYDGSAHRIFLNDKLSSLVGITNGWVKNTNPFMFLKSVVPDHPTTAHGVKAIIDNINIHDGIATKVRNTDPYEDYLVVDLAFDGENNSTKIIDNARLKERNLIPHNDNTVSLIKPINNNIIDNVGNNWVLNGTTFGPGVFGYQAITNGSISWADPGRNLGSWAVFYETVGSLDFYIKRGESPSSNVIFNYWYSDIRWKISLSNTQLTLDVYIGGSQTIVFNLPTKTDKFELFSLARHSDNKWELFVDGTSCGKSGVYSGTTYSGIGDSLVINTINGLHQISLVRFIKGADTYKSNFVLPTEPFDYIPKNNWVVSGNAKILTNQKFDGFSSLYLENNSSVTLNSNKIKFEMYEDFTISFEIIRIDNPNEYTTIFAPKDSNNGNVFTLNLHGYNYQNSSYIFLKNKISFVDESPSKNVKMIYSNTEIKYDAITKVSLFRKSGIMYMYINDKLDASSTEFSNIDIDLGNIKFGDNYVLSNTSFKGYIKNFKIYKGVAVIPENPTGKIQLDFDNNLNDKYGNSTWTNNGVTFDQVNSVKGYSAYFDGEQGKNIRIGSNSSLNYENRNFEIQFDSKVVKFGNYGVLLSTNVGVYNTNGSSYIPYDNNIGMVTTYNNVTYSYVEKIDTILNVYYSDKFIRRNANIYLYRNDVMISSFNISNDVTFNLNSGTGTSIGMPYWNTSSIVNRFNGYIDNFKSYKEDLLTLNSTVYKTNTNVNIVIDNESIYTTYTGTPSGSPYGTIVLNDSPNISNFIAEVCLFIKSDGKTYGILNFRTSDYSINDMDKFGYSAYLTSVIGSVNTYVRFGKGGNGTSNWKELGSFRLPNELLNDTYHIMKVVANGSNFNIYIDDQLMLTINDSTYTNASNFALSTYLTPNMAGISSRFKSIKISDLNGNVLYYKDWKSKIDNVIDKPAVHLPLETNAINTGFANLTVNSVGSPTYTTIDGKKCIKFEAGKYLTINSSNIFNLGTNSDFYIEIDIYFISLNIYNNILRNMGGWSISSSAIQVLSNGVLTLYAMDNKVASTQNSVNVGEFNNIKIFRKGNITSIVLNNIITVFNDLSFNFSDIGSQIGGIDQYPENNLNGYMSNFKMFVGTSEIPETYNDKKVLDLDFKPTGKSYLFKDNNNKCVIHPVNITQRDYQDSQYCCTFNGVDQYLQLGKNNLLNFGLDDFVINIKFKITEYLDTWQMILGNNINTFNGVNNYTYIAIQPNNTVNPSALRIAGCLDTNNLYIIDANIKTPLNEIVDAKVIYVNNKINIYINDIDVTITGVGSTTNISPGFNFNAGDNTYIGYNSDNHKFKGTIYSIKVLRNTTDLTLLENIPEDNGGGEVIVPLAISLNSIPDYYNPAENNVIYVTGSISNAFSSPILLATINGENIDSSYINITSDSIEGIYNYSIGILTNDLEGEQVIIVTARADGEEAIANRSFKIIRDLALDRPSIDLFGTSWYQSNTNKPVIIRKYNEEPMMYFDGYGCLYSTNSSWRFGLDKFTIELDFLITSLPINMTYPYHILSYGREYDIESWYSLEILSTGVIRFNINKGLSSYVDTASSLIQPNTKYKLAVTRDSNYTVRIFLNGVKVAEKTDKTNMDNLSPGQWFDEAGNIMYLGRAGVFYNSNNEPERHFKGYMKNVYIAKNECLYTNNYTPSNYFLSFENKSLLSFDETDIGFTVKNDNYNSNITWSNTNCSVLNKDLVITNNTSRLLSSENSMYLLDKNNWTLDLVFTPNQIITESSLLDMRHNTNDYQGLLIKQSSADPTSITIYLGSDTATQAYSYIINTDVNSLVANSLCHLKIVRSIGEIIVFINGVRKNKTTINTSSINTSNKVCLGNDLSFTKGFSGKIRQFRIINGTATDVYAFPIIEGETLK